MPMQMGWRWYGEDNDPITLSDIKQIPGVTSTTKCPVRFGKRTRSRKSWIRSTLTASTATLLNL